ncbi:16S rRNA (uracil(1498)-N(3))-methyltransferase [Malonomonas rubra]|uniref:16S rRNA (uracil(1498)-N(3))-methyltransferase n=1 Tax=Malonomonas rubra TaxID=57040 RepID=UPI0026EA2345|nr:16S rRNA (uracil(1498)-N(3))-methyltransferase [Malonomonas rubra]
MNLILLEENDFSAPQRVTLRDRRFQHLLATGQLQTGKPLKIGIINGRIGSGTIIVFDEQSLDLEIELHQAPPPPLPVTLLLALPRPKMLKRVLQGVTSLGVKQIYLINSYRVEKSFWGSPLLQTEKLREQLLLGLEQARDTILPQVHLRKRFKPFVEDELPGLCKGTTALVAHPTADRLGALQPNRPTTLAIGPEGGFIPYEINKLAECGFTAISLGERILRVETAVPALLSRLLPG